MSRKQIYIIVGTRPNFIKVTQFKKVATQFPDLDISVVHTGQHYDAKMADVFFEQFELVPDHFLNISRGTPNTQIAEIMVKLEALVATTGKPDLMMVVGDVNSTLAAAIAAKKMDICLAHLESGLRSFDRSMPEEVNRVITDELADYFFVTEQSGYQNLLTEGKMENRICFSGNTMIDTLVAFRSNIDAAVLPEEVKVEPGEYILMTMHRPATVDNEAGLKELLSIIENVTKTYKLVFPIHPRTLKNLESFGLLKQYQQNPAIVSTPPLDYFAFQKLIAGSACVITDSGGIQEETTFLQKPCLTLRPNTERPVTCEEGSNTLLPFATAEVMAQIARVRNGTYKKGQIPKSWDGAATERILHFIQNRIFSKSENVAATQ